MIPPLLGKQYLRTEYQRYSGAATTAPIISGISVGAGEVAFLFVSAEGTVGQTLQQAIRLVATSGPENGKILEESSSVANVEPTTARFLSVNYQTVMYEGVTVEANLLNAYTTTANAFTLKKVVYKI